MCSHCCFFNLGHSSGQIVLCRVVFWHFRKSTIYPCVSFWELGLQDSESCRSDPFRRERDRTFCVPIPFNVDSEALALLVRVCLNTSTSFIRTGNVSSSGTCKFDRYTSRWRSMTSPRMLKKFVHGSSSMLVYSSFSSSSDMRFHPASFPPKWERMRSNSLSHRMHTELKEILHVRLLDAWTC